MEQPQWEESWTHIKTAVDIVRVPVLILDQNLHVITANDSFYRTFRVDVKETEGKNVYELGNGQWNIPELKKLLEKIIPEGTFFKGFEMTHEFPSIGKKVMILNARQIHFRKEAASALFPSIILLAIEDITEIMLIADAMAERTKKLEAHMQMLEEEINKLK